MHYDVIVLGGGVAGLSFSFQCIRRGKSVILVDPNGVGGGASGAPASLANPATGPKAKLVWEAEKCYSALTDQLEVAQKESSHPIYRASGVLRPALDSKMARKMRKNYEATDWPAGWVEWMDENHVKAMNPEIAVNEGAVWVKKGMTIDTRRYLHSFLRYLQRHGLEITQPNSYRIEKPETRTGWKIVDYDGMQHSADHLVFTTGDNLVESKFWKMIPFNRVKGQLATFRIHKPVLGDYAIAARGYLARLKDDEIVVGSTYEHDFQNRKPEIETADLLQQKMERILPNLQGKSELIHQWAGVRCSTPDHNPVIGRHPHKEGLYVVGALGSKGMLHSGYLAKLLANHIFENHSLPKEVSIKRFT